MTPAPTAPADEDGPQSKLNNIFGLADEALASAIDALGTEGDLERGIECLRCLRRVLDGTTELAAQLGLKPPVKP